MENDRSLDGVLASETRKDIMKRLCERNYQPAELSKELEKDRLTISEHLETLREAGLVERIEREGHKWIFYKLSRAGQSLFPNQKRRAVFMAIALMSLFASMMYFFAYASQTGTAGQGTFLGSDTAQKSLAAGAPETTNAPAPQPEVSAVKSRAAEGQNEVYLYAALSLFTLCVAAALQFMIRKGNELVLPGGKK